MSVNIEFPGLARAMQGACSAYASPHQDLHGLFGNVESSLGRPVSCLLSANGAILNSCRPTPESQHPVDGLEGCRQWHHKC